jgi:putative sigma-54 modulation protein
VIHREGDFMSVNYFFQNLESSDAMKDYAKAKIDKLAGHFDSSFSANVRFRTEKINQIVEFELTNSGNQFLGTESASDMYAAMDILEKTLEGQIRRQKEKGMGKNFRSNER